MNSLKTYITFVFVLTGLLALNSCQGPLPKQEIPAKSIAWITEKMTELMVHDITNPPLAARFYGYACLSGYETIASKNKDYPSFAGLLNELPLITIPEKEI